MPIEISWYIPSRVIRAYCYGDITAEDLSVFPNEARFYFMSGTSTTRVHMLLDDAEARPLKFTIRQMHDILEFRMEDRDRIGWIVGVGHTNILSNVLIPLLLKTMGLPFKRVYTMNDAISFLKKEDALFAKYMAQAEEQV